MVGRGRGERKGRRRKEEGRGKEGERKGNKGKKEEREKGKERKIKVFVQ